MTGPDNYLEAERLARVAATSDGPHGAHAARLAQVHATLALAAATALQREGGTGTLPERDHSQWFKAAATPPPAPIDMEES